MDASASMWWPLLCTLLIVVLILGMAWWLKHSGLTPASRLQGRFKLHARCAVGPREQLLVVQVEDRCLLLGVTAHSIQVLDRFETLLDESVSPSATGSATASPFSAILNRLRQRPLKSAKSTAQPEPSSKETPLS